MGKKTEGRSLKNSVYNMNSCVHTLHTCVNVNKHVWDAHHGYLQAAAVLYSFSLLYHIDLDFIIMFYHLSDFYIQFQT